MSVIGEVKPPPARSGWHPIARRWYRSLRDSGQAQFYEPSDWAAAQYVAEVMTRHLQVEVVDEETGEKSIIQRPMPGAQMFGALWSAMGDLLTTEAERRRVRLEIDRGDDAVDEVSEVARLDEFRRRAGSG